MSREEEGQGRAAEQRKPPLKRNPAIIRMMLALKRQLRRRKQRNQSGKPEYIVALWTRNLGGLTILSVIIAAVTAAILYKTDQTMRAAQRPWVSVDLAPSGPLTFTPEEARVEIAFILKNSGNSPAINVNVDAEIAMFIQPQKNYIDQMLDICQRAKSAPDDHALLGHAIFPGRDFTYKISMVQRRSEIENALANFSSKEKNDWFAPQIIGCASYRFAFENGRHVTQFVVGLRKRNRSNPNAPLNFKMSDGDVPVSELVLVREFIGGNAD